MASKPKPDAPTDASKDAAPKGVSAALLATILAVVLGLAVGAGTGAFVVGPALASGLPQASAHPPKAKAHAEEGEEGADEEGEEEEEEGAEEEGAKPEGKAGAPGASVYTIENLVLNPAESGGTRFLLLSIAFEVKDEAALEQLKGRDAELRDLVLASVGKRTVEQLSDMVLRDSLKLELRDVAKGLLKRKSQVKRIYFPQFVIQ